MEIPQRRVRLPCGSNAKRLRDCAAYSSEARNRHGDLGHVPDGMGDAADKTKAKALPSGGFFAFPPGMTHFAFIDEDTVVQINSTGPWD